MHRASSRPVVSLDLFEGPLDLLLQLIEQQRLDITSIALVQVADQYLATVRAADAVDPAALAEFLVIGARLLVIKTRALLPHSPLEQPALVEEDTGDQLARQLREYQRFKQVAVALKERDASGLRTHLRQAAPAPPERPAGGEPPRLDIPIDSLRAAVERRLRLLRSTESPPVPVAVAPVLTIADVTENIHTRLRLSAWITFDDLLGLALTRTEVIVTLWAVLELFKRHVITLEQEALFDQITLGRGAAFE